jgi:hypothetical protein
MKTTNLIMRLNYTFEFGGRQYQGTNVDVGGTSNPNWYQEEGGKGKRYHKWSAIYAELPAVHDAIADALPDPVDDHNPSEFGFRFCELEKGE